MTIERVNQLLETYIKISRNVTIVNGYFAVGGTELIIYPTEIGFDVGTKSVRMPITTIQQVMDIFSNPDIITSQLQKLIN